MHTLFVLTPLPAHDSPATMALLQWVPLLVVGIRRGKEGDQMDPTERATPLVMHTLETLCDELVSGRGIQLENDEGVLKIRSPASRAIFDWYRRNRNKWAGKNMTSDVESIAKQVDKDPPVLPAIQFSEPGASSQIVHLKSIRAHRFAGIHRYGTATAPPPDFEFEVVSPLSGSLTIIEGNNGAGKTSLLSAITWCLTGHIYRSQRPPETAEHAVEIWPSDPVDITEDATTRRDISAITPLPPANVIRELGAQIPLDTWVELTFVDSHGDEVATIRRAIRRSARGARIEATKPNLSRLGLPPIALEVGTRMTGLLPYVRVGDKSDLGSAVAELTGLRPLRDLVNDAKKSQQKLRKALPSARQAEITTLDQEFDSERKELVRLLQDHVEIDPGLPLPEPSSKTCEEELAELKERFEAMQGHALAGAQRILGETFDVNDANARNDLFKNIGPAIGTIGLQAISRLRSASRLRTLAQLKEEDLKRTELLVETILAQAKEIAALAERPDHAARLRLYARVVNWIKEENEKFQAVDNCPVCETDLQGKVDRVTGRPIVEHFRQYLDSDCSHLEHTIAAWADWAFNNLSGELSDTLPQDIRSELPDTPTLLLSCALCDELFEAPAFSGVLAPLKSSVQQLCEQHLPSAESFVQPPKITLPAALESADGRLTSAIRGLRRAIAFARWRQANRDACTHALHAIIGTEETSPDPSEVGETKVDTWPLLTRLTALHRLVANSEPLRSASARIDKMRARLSERREKEKQIASYSRAAEAIQELLLLDDLVDQQVETLMTSLAEETARWKIALYKPAYTDAPRISRTDVQQDGSLVVDAESEGTKAAAQHICNSSDLRATLLAFLFAFWKDLSSRRGGLSLILLDDLQELFDPNNRWRVANAIGEMAADGATIILTTNDHDFARRVSGTATKLLTAERVDHRQVLPAKGRLQITLSKLVEEVQKKRRAFERNKDDHQAARNYLNELRIYLEGRLLDFFDVADSGMRNNPTFSDLVNAIRRRVNQGQQGFSGPVFGQVVRDQALREESEFVRLMNDSHHSDAHLITYNDVFQIREDCRRVLSLVHAAHDEYERWLRRDPPEGLPAKPVLRVSGRDLSFAVPKIEVTAAATADSPFFEIIESDEPFSCDWLVNHAVYVNTTDNFGFAGEKNCRVVVDLDDSPPDANSWVIALHEGKTYARRLLRLAERPAEIALVAETINPLNRPPALLLPASEVRLLKVVGVLFDGTPTYPRPKDEAELDEDCRTLLSVKIAFNVRGQSALPLVIQRQTILGGPEILPTELRSMEGKLVALATSDGCAFKRVGGTLPRAKHVRQFESVGGLGESLLARTEAVDDDHAFNNLPILESAREVLGVLYSPNV